MMKLRKEEIRVLIADWSLSYIENLKIELEARRFNQIEQCNDGESAIALIEEFEPHIVVVDQEIKYSDGLSILQYIAEQKLEIEIIFTSSCTSEILFRKADMLGSKFIITKPTQVEVIAQRIEDIYKIVGFDKAEDETIEEYALDEEYELEEDPLELIDEIGLENNIGKILLGFGIRANLKGYKYLKAAILMTVMNPNVTNTMTKELYPMLAQKYHTTSTSIEKDMRHAIGLGWASSHSKYKQAYFGRGVMQNSGWKKPSNGLFIDTVAEKIRHNLKGQISLLSI